MPFPASAACSFSQNSIIMLKTISVIIAQSKYNKMKMKITVNRSAKNNARYQRSRAILDLMTNTTVEVVT